MNATVDFKEISELDLDQIKHKLMHLESGEGWTLDQANAVEVEYRRFLYLMKTFPNEHTSPSVAVDTFWHYHILDTMKYAADCEQVFGYFLHHYPYIGMVGENAGEAHHDSGERMRELYEQTFAVSYNPGAAFCGIVHPPKQDAAFCGVVKPPKQEAAFCGIVKPPKQDAAFCGVVKPPKQDAAFCGVVKPPKQDAAFCGIVKPPKQKAAFCGIVRPPAQQADSVKAAFCGIVKPPKVTLAKSAFCGIVRPPAQRDAAQAAFCGIVRPPERKEAATAAFCGIVPPASTQSATAYCALGRLPHGAKGDAIRTNVSVAIATH